MPYFGGIDVGGSKIYSIIIDEKANILSRAKLKTNTDKGLEGIVNKIKLCFNTALESSGLNIKNIETIGIAVPSAVDIEKGVLLHAPNLNLHNIRLSKILYNEFGKPIFIGNDVNMGTFAENSFGSCKKYKNIYGIFMGTGIGGCYIQNGDIIRGPNYTAGEIGHMIIKMDGPRCGCGRKGCLEAISGKVGIINYIKAKEDKTGVQSILNKLKPDWKEGVGSTILRKAYKNNDKLTVKAIKKAAKGIGIAIANLINLIGIEAVVMGGGVYEELQDIIYPIIKKNMEKYAISSGAKGVKLLSSKLGDDAVALGAALFVSMEKNKHLLHFN